MGLEPRTAVPRVTRKKRHRLQKNGLPPAIMGRVKHDALSKSLFALPSVEADVLRIVAAGWVHLLDLDTLERLSAEHPSADLTLRAGDLTWRVRFREGELADGTRPWLLSPTELQSTYDSNMSERQFEYTGRHLRALRREGVVVREGEEPRVLPVVLYDGERRWRRGAGSPASLGALGPLEPGGYAVLDAGAGELEDWPDGNRVTAWVRLLRSRGLDELLRRLVEGLWAFPEAPDGDFRDALYAWAQALCERMVPGAGGLPPRSELEKRQEALAMTTLIEANLNKWRAGLVQEGIAQGVERGIVQGAEQERERLRELARQLDPETAAKVAELLDQGE